MNAKKVQVTIDKIITSVNARGWKFNKTTKKALKEIEELGLTEFIPNWMVTHGEKADAIISEIISQAKQVGGQKPAWAKTDHSGEGETWTDTIEPSDLYLAMNEETESSEGNTIDQPEDVKTIDEIHKMIEKDEAPYSEISTEIEKHIDDDGDKVYLTIYDGYEGQWISTHHGIIGSQTENGEWEADEELEPFDPKSKDDMIGSMIIAFYNDHAHDIEMEHKQVQETEDWIEHNRQQNEES